MTQESTQNAARSVLSWESVLDPDESAEQTPAVEAPTPEPIVPNAAPAPEHPGIAPLSLDPLSLDPLPPIAAGATPARDSAPVLGEFHLDLVPIGTNLDDGPAPVAPHAPPTTSAAAPPASPSTAPVPAPPTPPSEPRPAAVDIAPAATPAAEMEALFGDFDLRLAPFDVADVGPTTPAAATETDIADPDVGGSELRISALDAALGASVRPAVSDAPAPQPVPVAATPPAPALAPESAPAPATEPQSAVPPQPGAEAQTPPAPPAQHATASPPAALPADAVAADATPTTTIPDARQAEVAVDSALAAARNAAVLAQAAPPPIKLPDHQPNQAAMQRSAHVVEVPQPVTPKRRAKKQRQQSSGASGIALFFTLLVLVGLIVGAIIFGQPYLFPEEPPTATESDVVAQLEVVRQSDAVFAESMADELLGDWESMLPIWRSLALANGAIDTNVVQQLLEGWTDAFYSPALGVVVAKDSVEPAKLDGAIAEAMAIGALDQTVNWSGDLTAGALDANALRRAEMIAASRVSSSQTTFGSADTASRQIGPAAFLPPVLAYQVGAPIAFAEFAPVDIASEGSLLTPATMPELLEGDTLVTTQQLMDRTFWYLVFASYNDPSSAYAASNALVQSSVAIADRNGTHCTYATFTGTDVAGTERVGAVLANWAAMVPASMQASFRSLPDGTMQLTTCDPGVGFETQARFGVAREMTRWRSVELAALETVDPVTGTPADRVAAVAGVRSSQVALSLMEWPFDTSYEASAREARALVGIVEAPAAETLEPTGDATVDEAPPVEPSSDDVADG